MTGEINLDKLLASMTPILVDGEYVFYSFPDARYGDRAELEPVASCIEPEGLTLVIPKSRADEYGLDYDSAFRGISLGVHSSLEAVGLTAALATKLTEHGITANVVAGYFHDHIFVHSEHADKAMAALNELAR
ncbi:MAG: ACT domain-containing protein [Gammaproteobacteria bacterium]|nr:ACT domain-containing protein [Gammaproteobacteria bacterium]MDH3534297.1 ACT domain-containing protein [Gammaproteobacteria bacterium]